ncbi:Macrolide export ATP-binding/permease protein macB [Fibrella aestuarina BUZ 2]|uniref:Macrolide export ATP-binding/permease protein macB n=1 Tax=Fibrella aestuarina BUZ 2 TaxID=1166018 RepID=I0K273_9BACT|nr:ABC transporter permease [Fibrella aestuarina]CCG98226.1 Macrolide export ATP-binding/permease protein macB [Fibrella aestuarina BUZ 2]
MLSNYLRISWRNLVKHKVFSFINILGLAAGLSCCLLISLYVYDELSYDTQHPEVGQLYQIGTVFVRPDGEKKTAATPYPVADALKQEYAEIGSTTRLVGLFAEDKTLLRYDGPANTRRIFYETDGYLADPTFFNFFNYAFVEGRGESALVAPHTIVLSEEIAHKLFGNEPALNKVVHVESNTNGDNDYTVTGVFRPGTVPSHINARFFLSFAGGGLEQYVKGQTGMAGNNMFFTYLKLKPGTDARKLEAKLPAFVDKYMRKDLQAAGFDKRQFLTAVTDIHLHTDLPHNVTPNGSLTYLYILLSVAVFTLLIACINFMNLSTARSAKRSGEVGIRKALGAAQGALVGQFLSESFLFSVFAFGLALGFTWLLIPVFEQVSGKTVHFSAGQLLILLSGFFGLSLFTGLLAGSYPAFYLSSFRPILALKGREGRASGLAAVSLRRGLVVFQFTLSAILIIASLVIGQQMTFLRSTDLGFAKEQQLVIPLRSATAKASYTALKNALASNVQIASVGASAYYPGIFNPEDASFYGEGQTVQQAERTRTNRIDFDYLNTLAIRPVAGRLFSRTYPADTGNVILNERAVNELGYASPQAAIGQKAYTERSGTREGFTIVGVVKDFHFEDLHLPITPYAFTLNGGSYNYVVARAKPGDMQAVLRSVEAAWQKVNPSEPFAYSFLDDEFQKNYVAETRLATVVGYFTFIAILISCLGLFGLASFNVEQRTKEIGIRKVLGATVGNVVLMLSGDFLKLVVIAIVIASPLAWYVMQRWLENFAYQIQIGPSVFVLTALVALLITIATVSFQSIRAALMNPVKSLRSD